MPEKRFYAHSRKEWREWLRKNHKKESKVYLVKYKKHTGKPTVNNKEAMEEAICFGWIDTTMKRLDDEKYQQAFVKRKKNANWSKNTLRYAKELIKKRKMTKAGLEAYKRGLKKLPIEHNIPKNPDVPEDLKKALEKNKKAKEFFDKLAPSYRKFYIRWVHRAVRKETKDKRIAEVIKRCSKNKKPGLP